MENRSLRKRLGNIAIALALFGGGYVCGTLGQPSAHAQNTLNDLGSAAMKDAAGSGGVVGGAMELGTAIVDMQQHVDGLQKNIDVLKKVKASLGG